MAAEGRIMVATHDPGLVVLSVLVSILAAYAGRDLAARVRDARGRAWLAWLAGAATVDGIGTWSMHYTGKLALRLPVPVLFDGPRVVLSLLVGIVGSAAALLVVGRGRIRWPRALAGGILLGGVGISGLHYTAMAAMRVRAMHRYSFALAILSIVLGIALSFAAVALTFLLRDRTPGRGLRNHGVALVRGSANPVMHYTAMAAVTFVYTGELPDLSRAVSIASLGVLGISVVPAMVLVVGLLTSLADRIQKQRALLDELFEQAPQAVVLTGADDRIVRVNREFTRLFGYTAREALGRRIGELVIPDEPRDEDRGYSEMVARGRRVDAEGVRRRKDGSLLQVAIVRVPVTVPGGQVEVYSIYRDLTERERAESALRDSAERLRVLSRRVVEVQEEERRRLARELHDEIGQALTAIAINLQVLGRSCGPESRPRIEDCLGVVRGAIEQVRGLALDLRPSLLDDLGLADALRWLVHRQAERAGLVGHLLDRTSGATPPPDLATACFRVAQEALTNVVRPARARNVWVELLRDEAEVQLVIRDDGVGFDPAEARRRAARGAHLGLVGIQERAEMLGGRVDVESEPGHGTRIRAWFPVTSPSGPGDAGAA